MYAERKPKTRSTARASYLIMGTTLDIWAVGTETEAELLTKIERAENAMRAVERTLSRFDPDSELRRLSLQVGQWVEVSPILQNALAIALMAARLTDGAFDPTVGARMEALGFDRHYLTGRADPSGIVARPDTSYRDVELDEEGGRVLLSAPLLLDLGAVAKGLGVDLANRELGDVDGALINAGGDLYARGRDPDGDVWRVGVENPSAPDGFIGVLVVSDQAVCTSGGYRRKSPKHPTVHHLLALREDRNPQGALSATVVAPNAVLADVAASAAFLLGEEAGLTFLNDLELAGLIVSADGEIHRTDPMREVMESWQP